MTPDTAPAKPARKKWLATALPLLLLIGAGVWMVNGIGADTKTDVEIDEQQSIQRVYTRAERPAALTWMERGQKKLEAGNVERAAAYFDNAVAVGVDDISVEIAKKFWTSEMGLAFDKAKVEAIADSLSDRSKAEILAMMGESHLSGVPAPVTLDTKLAVTLLERAAALGNMDAEITLENFKTGRNVPIMSKAQVGSVIIDLGEIDTTPEPPRTIEAYDE